MSHVSSPTAGHSRRGSLVIVTVLVAALLALAVGQAPPAHAAVLAEKIAPAAAAVGTGITISGAEMTSVDGVTFVGDPLTTADDVVAPHFIALDAKKLVVQVPVGVKNGPVRVHAGTASSETLLSMTVLEPPAITSISPTQGVPGQQVVITGTNLLGLKKPKVLFGKKAAAPLDGASNTSMTVVVPGGLTGGPVDLSVLTTGGTAGHSFYVGPTIKGVAPKVASTAGGTVVAITGAGFTGADKFIDDPATAAVDERYRGVTFDGVNAKRVIAVSDSEIVAEVPAGVGDPATGVASVAVHTTATPGTTPVASSPVPGALKYLPLPVVTAISQDWGYMDAPTAVVLTGKNFSATDTKVFVGSTEVSPAPVIDVAAGTITLTPPPVTKPAIAKITVTNVVSADVSYSTVVPYAYVAPASVPTVAKVAPVSGPEDTTVLITGTNFSNDTTVTFGGVAAKCTVASHILVRCGAPAGSGIVDVAVTNAMGSASLASAFTYTEITGKPAATDPLVKALVPMYGTPGSTVTVGGANLNTVKKVEFTGAGGRGTWVDAPHYLVAGAGKLYVTVPEGVGTGELRLTANDGRRYFSDARIFYSHVRPTVTSIDVVGETTLGATAGDLLRINGSGLYVRPVKTLVTIGGQPAPVQTRPTPRPGVIVVKVPKSVGGRAAVVVTTPLGAATAPKDVYFLPEFKAAKPQTTSRKGGTVVTIGGEGFTGADNLATRLSAVRFGGANVADMVVMSDKSLVVTTAAGSASMDELVVRTEHSGRIGDSDGRVRWTAPPTASIDTVTPSSTPTGVAPDPVTITGTELSIDSAVAFGGVAGTVVSASSEGTSLVVLPPVSNTHGAVDVTVTNTVDGLDNTLTKTNAYSYVRSAPQIAGMSATTAPAGYQVTISGANFTGTTAVTFGGVTVPHTVGNDTTILATVPLTPSGAGGTAVPVVVTTSIGGSTETVNWTWDSRPTITGMNVSTGVQGTTVTLTGTSFTGATAAEFGSVPASAVSVISDTSMTVTVPVSPYGAAVADIRVKGPDGLWSRQPLTETANDWTWVQPAVISGMTPVSATTGVTTVAAGGTVTVNGTGFGGIRRVYIDQGAAAPLDVTASVVVTGTTSFTFTVPGRPGAAYRTEREVIIENGSGAESVGTTRLADLFTWG